MSPEDRKAMELSLANECKNKEGATDADVVSLVAREIPSTPTGKCLNACMVETAGLVKDGKPSVEGAVNLAKIAYDGNEDAMAKAKEVADECVNVADADRCELATKMMTCAQAALVKLGFNPKDMV